VLLIWVAANRVAVVACVVAIAAVTLGPTTHGSAHVQLRPLEEIGPALATPFGRPFLTDVVGNIALFVPLGALLALRRWPLLRAAAAGVTLSAAVEAAQLVVPGRYASVDDVLLNGVGTAVGWAAGVGLAEARRLAARKSSAGGT